jgi:hypothetical protein
VTPSAASIIDLIDDALSVVSAQQTKRLLHLLDESHKRLLQAREKPMDAAVLRALRRPVQELADMASYHDFQAGLDYAYALEQLSARLLVNCRTAPSEWRRVLALSERAFAVLAPRRPAE